MNQHPLILAMKNAGDATRRQAEFLQRTNYGDNETGLIVNLARLTDAMVDDWTGVSSLQDRQTLSDNLAKGRDEARKRRSLRVTITDALMRFPVAYREQLINQLAAGKGAEEAHNLQITADRQLALLLAGIRANVDHHATAAS